MSTLFNIIAALGWLILAGGAAGVAGVFYFRGAIPPALIPFAYGGAFVLILLGFVGIAISSAQSSMLASAHKAGELINEYLIEPGRREIASITAANREDRRASALRTVAAYAATPAGVQRAERALEAAQEVNRIRVAAGLAPVAPAFSTAEEYWDTVGGQVQGGNYVDGPAEVPATTALLQSLTGIPGWARRTTSTAQDEYIESERQRMLRNASLPRDQRAPAATPPSSFLTSLLSFWG